MTKTDFIRKIIEIKDTSLATVSLEGEPSNRIVDMMYMEDDCLYFLTAKGKNMYLELMKNPHVALTCCKDKVAFSLKGIASETDSKHYLPLLFENSPFMYDLYPENARKALSVFRIIDWSGEYFDLNKRPIERESFSYQKESFAGYQIIADRCSSCGLCLNSCPSQCIDIENKTIIQKNCLRCGNCLKECPNKAIEVIR